MKNCTLIYLIGFMRHYEDTGNTMWYDRARILVRVACYVFRVSKLEKTFENLRKLFSVEFLLTTVVENNLQSDKRVIDFLQTILYEEDIQSNKKINLNYEHRQQSGFLSMQLAESFSIWETFLKYSNQQNQIFIWLIASLPKNILLIFRYTWLKNI